MYRRPMIMKNTREVMLMSSNIPIKKNRKERRASSKLSVA